jgi:flagellar biosynthesis protein FlhF
MALERFTGLKMAALLGDACRVLGPDAVAVATRARLADDGSRAYELLAGDEAEARAFTERTRALAQSPAIAPLPTLAARPQRPYVIALAGPTGAGKTTTLAKLATHPRVFRSRGVGFLTLDTYRVGAVAQLRTYADIAGLPCEVAYESKDLAPAMARLARCRVVLVDTPGRGPHRSADGDLLQHWLDRLHPDEVHLVLPAGLRPELARQLAVRGVELSVTHLLATKLDEAADDTALFDVAAETHLPMRWYTDGQDVPLDLRPARAPLVTALALAATRAGPADSEAPPAPAARLPRRVDPDGFADAPAPAPRRPDPLLASFEGLEHAFAGEVQVLDALRSALKRVESLT